MNEHDSRIDPSLLNLDSGIFHGLPAPAVALDTFHLDTYEEPVALQPLPPLVRQDGDTLRPASLDDADVAVVQAPRRSSAVVVGFGVLAGVALALGGVALVHPTEATKADQAAPARSAAVHAPAPQPVAEASKPDAQPAAPAQAVPPAPRGFRPSAIRLAGPSAPLVAEAPQLVERYAEPPSPAAVPPAAGPPAGPTAELDRAAVAAAVAHAGERAASCRVGPGTMLVPVTLLYATSGRVTAARVNGGAFVGTSTGACIALALRGASVPAFAGDPVTVHTTVRLP